MPATDEKRDNTVFADQYGPTQPPHYFGGLVCRCRAIRQKLSGKSKLWPRESHHGAPLQDRRSS
eukprot:3078448-Rhodomonas_salina.3